MRSGPWSPGTTTTPASERLGKIANAKPKERTSKRTVRGELRIDGGGAEHTDDLFTQSGNRESFDHLPGLQSFGSILLSTATNAGLPTCKRR